MKNTEISQELQTIGNCGANVREGIATYLQENFPQFTQEYVKNISADLSNIVGNKIQPIMTDYINLSEYKNENLAANKEINDGFWNIKEVMKFFRVSRQTIHQWIKDGTVKSFKIGGLRRFKKSDIENMFN